VKKESKLNDKCQTDCESSGFGDEDVKVGHYVNGNTVNVTQSYPPCGLPLSLTETNSAKQSTSRKREGWGGGRKRNKGIKRERENKHTESQTHSEREGGGSKGEVDR